MLLTFKENLFFLVMVLLWLATGVYFGNVAAGVIGASFLFFVGRGLFAELLIGFWFILIFSDNLMPEMAFAGTAKKAMIVLLLVIFFLQRHLLAKEKNFIFSLFTPFFLWSMLILYDSPWIDVSFQKTLSYSLLFLLIPVFTRYVVERDQRAFFKTAIFMMTVYLFMGIAIRYVNFDLVYQAGRFKGLMGNPNGLGLLVFIFALFLDTILKKVPDLLSRPQLILIWALVLLNFFYCQSRSALFAFMIYMLFSRLNVLRGFLGVLVFITILVSYGYVQENLEVLIYEFGLEGIIRTDNLEGGSGRLVAWEFAWLQIQDNFIIGRGFAYTDWIFWQNYDLLTNMGHLGNAHNSFITFWLDTGLIGLVFYVIAFFLMFFRIAKVYNNAIPVMYAVLFSASFESWLTASLNPNTITLLMTLSIMMYAKDESEIEELELDAA